ncbi:MAG: hypothetical protein ACRDQD_15040 [Nocardioidaceae bacterium]
MDQFADMNRRFYASSSSPHGFIRQRVRAVLVAGSRDDHVLEAQRGLRLGKFVAGFPEDDPLLDPTSVNSFVMTESVVLFHHAAESLIRLVLAHIGDPACPWLEMRRLTFNRYKSDMDRLHETLDTNKTRRSLMAAFYGSESADTASHPAIAGNWQALETALVQFLDVAITQLRSGGELYNAAKHGIAIAGGEDRLKLLDGSEGEGERAVDDAQRMILSADGHCLTYLHKDPSPPPRWMMTVTWANPERNLALTQLAANLIENLWVVARAKYLTDANEPPPKLHTPDTLASTLRITGNRSGTNDVTVSTYLRYEGDGGVSGKVSFSYPADGSDDGGSAAALRL